MKVEFTKPAANQYRKLSLTIKKKVDKQLLFLQENPKHPSLRVKKMASSLLYEARIDRQYRLRFLWENDSAYIISVGPHDEGLGKK